MCRFAVFVDGSNLFGALRAMNLEVDDYQSLYGYVFKEAHTAWETCTHQTEKVPAELRRVYWYTVGSIDQWDLSLPQSQTALRNAFGRDKETRDYWLALTGKGNPALAGADLEDRAWAACLGDFRDWYDKKCSTLEGMRRFYQAVRISTDLIEVIEHGHWKVDFLHKWVEEKGLDVVSHALWPPASHIAWPGPGGEKAA